jgi:hypothetical protein
MKKLKRALVVRQPHIDRILAGSKTWEIRGSSTAVREAIGLIQSGSGQIVGTCEVVDVVGPLSLAELKQNAKKAGFAPSEFTSLPYRKTYAWVLNGARRLRRPRSYRHPSGAVIWVRLDCADTLLDRTRSN